MMAAAIPCTACGIPMQADFRFCPRCGQEMPAALPDAEQPPFVPLQKNAPSRTAPAQGQAVSSGAGAITSAPAEDPAAPPQMEPGAGNAFAQSLPGWDLEPPQAPVLQKGRL